MAFLRTPWRGCRDAARLISAWNVTLTLLFCILSGQGSSFFVSADDAADEEIIETAEPEASEKMDGSEAGEGDPHTGISYILFAFFVLLSVYRFFKAFEPTELEKRVKAAQAAKAALDARMALEAVTGAPANEPHAVGPTAHVIHILVDSQSECLRLKEELAKEKEEDVLAKFQELAKQYSICPSKDQGGTLGTFSQGVMNPVFDKAVFTQAEVGKVHGPVKTTHGHHLMFVVERSGTHKD